MKRKQYTNLQVILATFIIIFLAAYMIYALKFERPYESEFNYSNKTFDVMYDSGSIDFNQSLDIFKNDRIIKSISIYLENNLQESDIINISIDNNSDIKTVTLEQKDFGSGWYTLPFSYEEINSEAKLIISANNTKGILGVGVTSVDLINAGECTIKGTDISTTLAIRATLTINNIIWDEWGYTLIIIFCLTGLLGVFCSYKCDDGITKGIALFVLAIGLNIISLIVLDPYFMSTSHIAENSLNFYYLTEKYSILESLTQMDAGYLPLLQRLIAIIYVKLFKLGTDALYYMQATGGLIDIVILATFNLYIFRGKTHASLRFSLSICMFLLFIHPTTSTYFNFAYIGYFLVALLLTSNLDKLKKYQFILLCLLSFLVCMSKGFYAVMLPIGIIELVLFYPTAGKRKNIYAIVIAIAAALEVCYAFIVGDSWNKWFGTLDIAQSISKYKFVLAVLVSLFVICLGTFTLLKLVKYWYKVSKELRQKWMNAILLAFLFLGSLMIGTIAFHQINIINLFDWGRAWYDPAAMALILLLCELAGIAAQSEKRFGLILSVGMWIVIGIDVAMSLFCTRDKLFYCYRCVSWEVYKDYFDQTIVPVFMYDQRFGTLSDEYTLWYTGRKPTDNYAYGAPYEIIYLEINSEETNGTCENANCFSVKNSLAGQGLSAVYLNYINGVGNTSLQLLLYDEDWQYLGNLNQISPLSSRTIGFIADNPIENVVYLVVKTTEGKEAYVTKDAYFVTK